MKEQMRKHKIKRLSVSLFLVLDPCRSATVIKLPVFPASCSTVLHGFVIYYINTPGEKR